MTTKKDLDTARNEQELLAVIRLGRINAIRDYVIFWASIGLGGIAFSLGGLKYFFPTLLKIEIYKPIALMIGGIALTVGPKAAANVIRLLKKFITVL